MHGYWGGSAFGWGNHYWGIGMMILFALIFIGLIVWAVYWAARRGGNGSAEGRKEDPLEILKARFARGEITADEFRSMKAELTDSRMTKR